MLCSLGHSSYGHSRHRLTDVSAVVGLLPCSHVRRAIPSISCCPGYEPKDSIRALHLEAAITLSVSKSDGLSLGAVSFQGIDLGLKGCVLLHQSSGYSMVDMLPERIYGIFLVFTALFFFLLLVLLLVTRLAV